MSEEKNIQAIERFLSNQSTYFEAENIADYLLGNDKLLEELIPFNEKDIQSTVTEKQKREIILKIIGKTETKVFSIYKAVAAAAIFIGIMIGIWYYFSVLNRQPSKEFTEIAQQLIFVKNNTANDMLVMLPDSSTVLLTPQSEIKYEQHFDSLRNVHLIAGSSFFDVRKDAERPFNVISEGIQTRVLGTQFWVVNNKNINTLSVKLIKGRVALSSVDKNFSMTEFALRPGQTCYINKNTGFVKVETEIPEKIEKSIPGKKTHESAERKTVLWTNEEVQFEKAGLENVLFKIEARYNKIIIADKDVIHKSVLTGTIYNTDSFEKIMKSICDINNLKYEIRNDSVFISKKK